MHNFLSKSLNDTEKIALDIINKAKLAPVDGSFVITLSGNLGSGKTTLTQFIAKELGINEHVKSPTFLIMETYPISFGRFHRLIHLDAYRIERPEEVGNLGFADLLKDPSNLIILEWPEKMPQFVPENAFRVNLSFIDKDIREISF
ncbi:MAG: tRNA (adenosine(37)-N6)-threonylcarbamoyltransferase complex ATPase subunit type 1 TsaE [Minisyncoccia bacterium]